jgi:hypothetical protein
MITRHETCKKVHTLIKGKKLDSSILASINEVLPSDFLVVDPITDAISGSSDYKNVGDLNPTRKRVVQVQIITNNKFIVFNRRSAHHDEMTINAAEAVHKCLLEVAADSIIAVV